MPNIFAPFGFAESHRLGAAPNYQMAKRWINPANAVPIYFGDPVVMVASSGYIAQASPQAAGAGSQIAGIFAGCEYISKSSKKPIWTPWWPGTPTDVNLSGTGFDVAAKVIDDPGVVFRVQANGMLTGTPAGQAPLTLIGNNATFTFGLAATTPPGTSPAPNQFSGISNVALDVTVATPAGTAFPFRIIDFIRDPPGVNGTDPTSAYFWLYVTFNNQDYKTTAGHG